ncbi:MAG: ArsA family ATPase [Myxococcota bacterium]
MPSIHIFCGAGGVGKTTLSAAFAIALARQGQRVAIITIDPARRLAEAFGLNANGLRNSPTTLPNYPNLDAMTLHPTEVFDAFVKQHSTVSQSKRLFNNRYYRYASEKMSGIHEYMAMLRLTQLVEMNCYDAIVLDTPPAKNALDFLYAPERIQGLMGNTTLSWLKPRQSWSALQLGIDIVQKTINGIIGSQTLSDLFDFFDVFARVGDALQQEASKIDHHLKSEHSRFYLVCSPQLRSVYEATELRDTLDTEHYQWSFVFVNRIPQAIDEIETSEIANSAYEALWAIQKEKRQHALSALKMLQSGSLGSVPTLKFKECMSDQTTDILETLSSVLDPALNQQA